MRFPVIFLTCSVLVAGAFGAAAQSPQLATATSDQDSREIRNIVEGAARNDAGWRKQADDYIRGEQRPTFGNRAHASDRAIRLLEAVDERCRRGDCQTGRQAAGTASVAQSPAQEVARIGKTNVCSAYPIEAVGVRRWTVPAGSLAFDFQPRGVRPSAGAIPIVPGDTRLIGGPRGERYVEDYVLTGDSLLDVRGFKTAVPPGRLRVILLGSIEQRRLASRLPFGPIVEVNGRILEVLGVAPNRWLQRGMLTGADRADATTGADLLPGVAPAIVFEADGDRGQLTLGFPTGIEVGAVIIEPADQPTSFLLDSAAPNAVASDTTCLREQEKIDRALAKLPSGRPPTVRTPTVETAPRPPTPTPLSPS
jgi:hypothetical protein